MLEEKIVLAKNSAYPLNGILTLPDDLSHKVPAVVFVHGSGSSNMDEKVGKLTPFKDLAQGLALKGIASIRYDKRTFVHGFKMVRDKKLIMTVKEETIDDALLASELLRHDRRIDADRIFVVGHSMGAMLAPRIDAEGGNYRGLILMAGSPNKLEDIMLRQLSEMSGNKNKLIAWIFKKQYEKYDKLFTNLYDKSDDEAKRVKLGNGMTLYYFKEMGEKPADMYLKTIEKPVFIMQGSNDIQVSVDLDYGLYQEMLKDRENVSFKLYEGLNHAFVNAICDNIINANKEFSVERHIGDEVIDDMADWINNV